MKNFRHHILMRGLKKAIKRQKGRLIFRDKRKGGSSSGGRPSLGRKMSYIAQFKIYIFINR